MDCRTDGHPDSEQMGIVFLIVADRGSAGPCVQSSVCLSAIRNALLLCCLALAHSLAQTVQPDNQPKKLAGTVINAVTKAPIPRALVFSSDNRWARLTDSEGQFEFTMPRDNSETGTMGAVMLSSFHSGSCFSWLQARKPGFFDGCIESTASDESSDNGLTISLVPEAIIYGRVTLANGDVLSGTDVQLFFRDVADGLPRWVPRNSVGTNSAGEFRFAELTVGEYKLLTHERTDDDPNPGEPANSFAYPPVFYPGAADFASAATIHLSAGQSFPADLSAVRQAYYRVTIPVANDDMSERLQVTVQAQAGPGFSLGYNARAKRIEGFLPNGIYVVDASGQGPNSASGSVNLKVNGAAADGPTMTLVPNSAIRLDVKENLSDTTWSGEAQWSIGNRMVRVHGPRVYLQARLESTDAFQPMRGGSLRPPTGPNDESLVLENVAPGHYWLRLDTSRGYVASARIGDIDLLRQPLSVSSGASAPIEIEMRDDAAELDGTVTGMAAPAAGPVAYSAARHPWVYCVPLPDSPGRFVSLAAFEDGHFSFAMMPPGSYRILAFATQQLHLPYRDAEAMKAYEAKGQVVHLSAGQKVTMQIAVITDSDPSEK